uniref:Peptidase S1 domain-containing protein n=1 Tax=Gopherus evgoodei TaxID=1825980 RepID=A0A8C4WMV6_9SAUR
CQTLLNGPQNLLIYLLLSSLLLIIWVQEAKPHSKPYMAYLYIQHGDNSSLCGGFLVSENFVLMAAHCNGDKIIVILGAHDITKQEQSQQVIPVRHAYPHQDYDNKTHNNEIMLLKLEHKAHLKEYVRLIPLPMGRTSAHNYLSSDTLQEVDVVVMPDADVASDARVCCSSLAVSCSISQGDSGGPLGTSPAVYTRVSTFILWIQKTMRMLQP